MELHLKKNQAAEIMIPMIDSTTPANFKSGESVTDAGYYKDGAGSWTALAITDTVTEISTTGMYTIELTAAEMNHDLIMIKFTAANSADSVVIIRTFDVDVEDLVRSTVPANTLDVNATGEAGIDLDNTSGTLAKTTDITGFNDILAADVWAVVTRALTDKAGFTISGTKQTLDALNDIAQSDILSDATAFPGASITEIRLAELAVANLPTDIDTLLTRISAAVALASVCTETRLAELDAANLPADVAANATPAEVNAEVVDVLKTDTIPEQAQGIPPTSPTFEQALMYFYMMLRNKIDVDSGFKEFYNNAGAVIWKKAVADDGTNYNEGTGQSGP